MIKGIYVVRDVVANNAVGAPLLFASDAPAIRFFSDACRDPQTMMAKFSDDFQLLHIGDLDEESCECMANGQVRVVITSKAIKAAQPGGE